VTLGAQADEPVHEDQRRFIAGPVRDVQPPVGGRDLLDDDVAAGIDHGGLLL
jgi:hypothetical protein